MLELRGDWIVVVAKLSIRILRAPLGLHGVSPNFWAAIWNLWDDSRKLARVWRVPGLRTADRWGICSVQVKIAQWYQLWGSRGSDRACEGSVGGRGDCEKSL